MAFKINGLYFAVLYKIRNFKRMYDNLIANNSICEIGLKMQAKD